jgi:predicted dehydrogenase
MSVQGEATLRVAVVGLRMGAAMLEALIRHPRAEVVAICDPVEERTEALAQKYGIDGTYLDFESLMEAETLDGICISTPNRLHAPMVRTAIERGLHVMCEKPLTLDTGEARELLALARAAGITHGTNFSNRPNPAVHFMKEQIAQGVLGRVYEAHLAYLQDWLADTGAPYTWRNSRAESGSGALGDIGSHVLDLGRLFLGEITAVSAHLGIVTPERVRPDGTVDVVDADDLAYMQFRFASGTQGLLRVSRVARGRCDIRRVELYGEKASLVLEIDKGISRVLRADEATAWRGDGFRTVFAHDANRSTWGGNVTAWVDAALEGREMAPSFEDGLRVQQICDAALRSDDEQRWVNVAF